MRAFARACRSLARRRAFTVTAVVTLAAGIAAATTLVTVVDTVIVKPLPFPGGDRIVTVYEASPASRERASLVAPIRLEDWNRLNRSFEALSGSYTENVTDTSGSEPERLAGRRVTPRFFTVFDMSPLAGRTFSDDEERFGGARAAVISEGLWTRRYGRSPAAVGARLSIGGAGYTIVGVMPQTFTTAAVDIWLPAGFGPGMLANRDARFLQGIGRMRPGVTIEQAGADLARVQVLLGEQFPKTDRHWSVTVRDLKQARVGDYRRALLLVLGAVLMLLAIAVANVAGLMLVQLHRRAPEIAIRSAIGASRAQVIAAVMWEVVVMAAAGAVMGGGAAAWLIRMIATTVTTLPRVTELGFDWRAALAAAGLSAAAALVFGVVPALYATRGSGAASLSPAGRGAVGGRHRLQAVLVAGQIALSVLLAGSAALLLRSYYELSHQATGFNTDGAITFHVGAAWDEDRARVGRLQETLVSALQRLPGVTAAGFTNFLPATGATLRYQVTVDGLAGADPGGLAVGERTVTSGYLRAMQAPLLAGSWCPDLHYDLKAPFTVMVNRRFVDTYGQGQNLLGRGFRFSQDPTTTGQIVGVVGDMIEDGQGATATPYVYVCLSAGAWPDPEYVVRASGDPRALVSAIHAVVRGLDATRPIFGMRPVADVVQEALDQPRLNACALASFAAAAMALASIGLYGLLMLVVTERRRELGVRMALGAAPSDVVWLVLRGVARLVAAGVVPGLILTVTAGRVLRAALFSVTPLDVLSLAAATASFLVVTLLAAAIPARRAARVGAMEAIRGE